ncbi:MAG TPA: protein kinase [Thermoanaerobaculia bacterium]|nr:protein kinase [Thermoanaerobaculia bacterium]
MTLAAGFRLGPYEIVAPLGAGGMGEVYRARDTRLERDVAVKVLPASIQANPEALARFEREAKLVAALSHPNILAIHDVGIDAGVSYAVTELLLGETLRDRINAGAMPLRKAIEYGRQIARGLAAAHARGIVHRDLKPENVFVTSDGVVKILDFGLAKRESSAAAPGASLRETVARTTPGTILGTVGYMSPEQVRGETLDPRTDIFSFGAMLYELAYGERAFRADSDVETMTAILREDPPALRRRGGIPNELARVIARCLEKKPEERFQSASDLGFVLEMFAEAETAEGSGEKVPGSTPQSPSSPRATISDSSRSSIAVLPFRNMSPEKENEYFTDGITEEIINALSKIKALNVASRTSAFAFKGRDEDVRRIGEQLGVRTVLEGSVRRSGTRLRITAELVNVTDGYQLWSERYDREMVDVFEIQDEIALAIANTLKIRLLAGEEGALVSRATDDVEAYNFYLKGKYFFNRRAPRQAIAEFEAAIARDPGYAPAHNGLADAYCIFGFYGGIPTLEAFAKARAAASKALEIDPDAPETHVALALVEHYFGWDFDREDREFLRAIELAPRSAAAHSWLALKRTFLDDPTRARPLALRARELEPLSPNVQTNVAWTYFAERRYADAEKELRRALELDPDALYPLWVCGLTLQVQGKSEESVALFEKAVALTDRAQTWYLGRLGGSYGAAGRRKDALAVLEELRERSSSEYVAPFHVSFVHMGLGDPDAAIRALELAVEQRNALAWWPRRAPEFDPLRSNPRFVALLEKITPA